MKIRQVNLNELTTLLNLMSESHQQESNATPQEWDKTQTAITVLLEDPQAGEAYFILDYGDNPIGYMILCRGFSLDYGGYFTWIEALHPDCTF